ncbi:MAG: 5'-nucleotidase, lipoprotein e(P4) family [Bacteroidales bacterium]
MRIFIAFSILVSLSFCPGSRIPSPDTDQLVMATLWYQKSAEMRALSYQAFNLAGIRVEQYLAAPTGTLPPAVVFDIDETLLDNSPAEVRNILEGKPYSQERWREWTSAASAAALPGSVDFCKFLYTAGVEVFYVSNRDTAELFPTIENMKKLGFPSTEPGRYLLRAGGSGKEGRRNQVRKGYELILLVGDNLGDFSDLFENRSQHFGFGAVDSQRDEFGKRFIVLPNPMYGDWTKPLAGASRGLRPAKLAAERRGQLELSTL